MGLCFGWVMNVQLADPTMALNEILDFVFYDLARADLWSLNLLPFDLLDDQARAKGLPVSQRPPDTIHGRFA